MADQSCGICHTQSLRSAACIQLSAPCRHIFHFHCIRQQLRQRWPTPYISFRFLHCPLCQQPLSHPSLVQLLQPLIQLRSVVEQLALTRLINERREADDEVATAAGRFHNDPLSYALHLYAFYQCYKVTSKTTLGLG